MAKEICPECLGKGTVPFGVCLECNGVGAVSSEETLVDRLTRQAEEMAGWAAAATNEGIPGTAYWLTGAAEALRRRAEIARKQDQGA